MNFILEKDIGIIRKYKDGRDVDEEDLPRINALCSIGLMNKGISLQRKVVTAKPTYLGISLLD
ncbi:MAG: hypothetical protein PHR47_00045 [Candidatus Pacebacteria bacterium]|nr:hypothetical protein [Candidatus Paceibacterota bacterium]